MGKICILSTVNLKHMTLVSLYTEYMDRNNIPYDIVYIDKYHEDEKNNAENAYKYDLYIERDWCLPRKFWHYWGFKKYASEILMRNQYSFVITWNVFTAFMFADILRTQYKKKYCVNIRDVSTNVIVKAGLNKAINNSSFVTISSDGFRRILPPHNYLTVHSMNMKILSDCVPHTELKSTVEPINITYIGYMCYYDNCYKLIDELGNDERFRLRFYGQGSDPVKDYAEAKGYNNVECSGRFEVDKTASLIQDADIIYNLYGAGHVNLDTALSIKLYYAIYLNVPILVCKGTYMEEVSKKCGIGFAIGQGDFLGLGDKLFSWYHSLHQSEIMSKCAEFQQEILSSHRELEHQMDKYLGPNKV